MGIMVGAQGPGQQRREAVAHSIAPPVRSPAPAAQGAGGGRYRREPAAPCPQTPIPTTRCESGVPDPTRPTARVDRVELMFQAQREAVRAANAAAQAAHAAHVAQGAGTGGYGRAPAARFREIAIPNVGCRVADPTARVDMTMGVDRVQSMLEAQREAVRAANSTAATVYAPHAAPAAPVTLGAGSGGYGRAPAARFLQVPVPNAGGVAPGPRAVDMDEVRQRQAAR
ncbi:unnamed protein product [Sphacelaria rigidula]